MKTFPILLAAILSLLIGVPAFAQEPAKADPPKPTASTPSAPRTLSTFSELMKEDVEKQKAAAEQQKAAAKEEPAAAPPSLEKKPAAPSVQEPVTLSGTADLMRKTVEQQKASKEHEAKQTQDKTSASPVSGKKPDAALALENTTENKCDPNAPVARSVEQNKNIVGYRTIQVKGRQHRIPVYADAKR